MILTVLVYYLLKLGLMELIVLFCCWGFGWEFDWGYAFTAWLLIYEFGGRIDVD